MTTVMSETWENRFKAGASQWFCTSAIAISITTITTHHGGKKSILPDWEVFRRHGQAVSSLYLHEFCSSTG